jgi:hypothetical protein
MSDTVEDKSASVTNSSGSEVGKRSPKYWRTSPNMFFGVRNVQWMRAREDKTPICDSASPPAVLGSVLSDGDGGEAIGG